MVLHRIIISFATYLVNIERFFHDHPMFHVRVCHVLTQHTYWVRQVRSCAWHTSETQLLVDMEILLIHHFHSHTFITSLWDPMELQWAYIPPFKNASIFP